MKKCFVIYNDQSGKAKANNYIHKIYSILEKHGFETTIIHTKYKHHAEDIVYEIDDADLVIAAGGDGTFSEVMTGNLKRKKPLLLGNLPLGTTNDVGHMYGYKRNLLTNLNLLLEGNIKNVDVCTINGQVFTYVAGFGNFLNIAYDTPRKLKKKFGKLGYLIYGLNAVRDKLKFFDVTYKIDGVSYQGKYSLLFITNSDRVASVNDIYENVKLDDGKFEVVFCNLTSKREMIKKLCLLSIKHIDQIPGFIFYQTDHLEMKIKDKQNTPWCIDGERLEDVNSTYHFQIIRNVKLLVPSKNEENLFIK